MLCTALNSVERVALTKKTKTRLADWWTGQKYYTLRNSLHGVWKLISRQDKALDNLPYQHTCNIRQNKWKIIFNILLYCIHDSLLKKILPSQRSLPTMVFSASLFWIDVCMYINSNLVELYELIKIPRKIISHLGVMALLLNSKNSFGRLPRL